ncbi:transforming acidic coiled-coil-containing protein 3-like isoform X5 [Penaeus japonicus]|uniref:transforming acidic coiled-coil-containing protein 3-like isoform X5 n=1 Tax=Penaeus japonicus TaxID=27405 RepID=UPI001C70B442|nr:transforming acidic coiled-coil-containing protein 3-like isoform X5 [Penaeus japonicus]
MIGDVLDWDTGFQVLCLITYIMGLRQSKGTQSASKTDSGQKKKGAPAPPGSGGPEDNPEKEADGQKDSRVVAQSDVCVTQPSSPSLPPANVSSPSLTKECENTSVTEETSFASCLTEETSTLSECCVLPSQNVTLTSEALGAPGKEHQADPLSNSDSEYESAEELDSPAGSTAVVEEPPSSSANVATNQTQSTEEGSNLPVPIGEDQGVEEKKEENRNTEGIQNSLTNETRSQVIQETVNGHPESDSKDLANTITDSLVTVTKSEIIEESIQVLSDVSKTNVTEPERGETQIITTQTVETNGNLSEVHAKLSTAITENSQHTDTVKETICNVDDNLSKELTDNLHVGCPVTDDQNNSNHIGEPVNEKTVKVENNSENSEQTERNSSPLLPPQGITENTEEIPIPPKKAYNLDFLDNLEDPNFNPFATKTVVRNTPPASPEPGRKPLKPAITKKKQVSGNEKVEIKKETKAKEVEKTKEEHIVPENKPDLKEVSSIKESPSPEEKGEVKVGKEGQLLEISIDDVPKAVCKPPRNLGKRPQPKPRVKKSVEKNNNTVINNNITETEVKSEPEEELPIPPSKGYNLDFLDKLDDPNFNPFTTKASITNSPPKDGFVAPADKEEDIKPKAKVVTPKKSPAKKGFSVIKKVSKKPTDEVDSSKKEANQSTPNPAAEAENQEELPAVPKKGYNLDFLDDPNFDPFQTRSNFEGKPSSTAQNLDVAKNKAEDTKAVKSKSEKEEHSSEGPKPTEASEKSEDQQLRRLDADGCDDISINTSSAGQDKEEVEDKTEQKSKTKHIEDQQAEVKPKPSEADSHSLKENTAVPEEKPQSVEKVKPLEEKTLEVKPQEEKTLEVHLQEEKTSEVKPQEEKTLEVKHQASEDKTQVSEEKEDLQVATEEGQVVENQTKVVEIKPQVAVVKPQVAEVKPLVIEADPPVDKGTVPQKEELLQSADTACDTPDSANKTKETTEVVGVLEKAEKEVQNTSVKQETNIRSGSGTFEETSLPKVPSIGRIGQLDSLEFAQLLGNEASRLAEEFMNCSCDSGLPDSDDSNSVKCTSSASDMDPSSKAAHYTGAHLDESVNPFMKNSRLARSPPLGKRGAVCGAESGDSSEMMDPFKPRRSLRREEVLGEDRQDTLSVDEDSGIVMPTRSDLEVEVNHSEAGPEIATGLTSSDLRCASQCLSSSASSSSLRTEDPDEDLGDQITDEEFLASEAFFKEASDLERQFRRNLSTPMGSQSKLSGDEVTPIKEKPEHPSVTPESPQNKPVPSTSTPIPPREERSAPEGTSSPTPRPSDTSEHKPSSSRPLSVPADGYVTTAEVEELLKRQSLQFEEKLLRAELAAGEKERKLIQAMKEEQKEKGNLGGSLTELTQSRDALLKMVGQYKGMLAQLVGEKEKEKQGAEERIKTLETERNQALDDLANVENAFSDVHRKYERTKQVVDTLRRNEETLRGAITDYETKLQKQEQKFIEFQKHAEEKIQLANEEFETMRKANEQEMTKMAALLKKAEMKIVSLQDAFDRKTRENQELTQLCDDLINKVGGTN